MASTGVFGNGARKFFVDMIESVLGTIFIDSVTNLETREAFLERIGLLHFPFAQLKTIWIACIPKHF